MSRRTRLRWEYAEHGKSHILGLKCIFEDLAMRVNKCHKLDWLGLYSWLEVGEVKGVKDSLSSSGRQGSRMVLSLAI